LEDIGVHGRVIFKGILKKHDVNMLIRSYCSERANVNVVMNHLVPQTARNFLNSWAPLSA